jgi:hypothetical protein
LWEADYERARDSETVAGVWDAEQEPARGKGGPTRTDRIRVVSGPEVPGSGPAKPNGPVMRVELHPYHATPGGEDGDVNESGDTNRAEVYGRFPSGSATSTPPEEWPDAVGSTRWYGFSVHVPPGFATSDEHWLTITQWKGMYGGSPPLALEIDGGEFELGGTKGRRPLGAIKPGTWTRFEFGVHWSPNPEKGWVQVFRDGKEILARERRATMDTYDGDTVDPIYLKQGIYRATGWDVVHVLHFGSTRVGGGREALSP